MTDILFSQARLCGLGPGRIGAVAVRDGRIVAVETDEAVSALTGPETRIVRLGGACLLPGFHDAHCHVLNHGLALGMADLTPAGTIDDLLVRLQEQAARTEPGPDRWVRGRGYDQNRLADRRHPTRHDLDRIRPAPALVLVTHASGHAVSLSSRALERAGIGPDTPDPPGGTIVRDAHGAPTGVLLENAMGLAHAALPPLGRAERVAALARASRALLGLGITSACDAAARLDDIPAYRAAAEAGDLAVRCTLMPLIGQLTRDGSLLSPRELSEQAGPHVRIGPAKLFSDGALTTRTALLRAPFADVPDSRGQAIWTPDHLQSAVGGAHAAGWQVAAHAIGDGAIDLCLDAFEAAQAACPRSGARHRIEHAMLLWDDQIVRMERLGVIPVYQPEFIARFGDAYLAALGPGRAGRLMPYRAGLLRGLPLVFSSDLPVVPGAPLDGIAAAMERRTPENQVLGPEQRVSFLEAVQAYTAGAAYSVFAEQDRGALAPGQRADFVVLAGDPSVLPPGQWPEHVSVQAVVLGGEMVFGGIG